MSQYCDSIERVIENSSLIDDEMRSRYLAELALIRKGSALLHEIGDAWSTSPTDTVGSYQQDILDRAVKLADEETDVTYERMAQKASALDLLMKHMVESARGLHHSNVAVRYDPTRCMFNLGFRSHSWGHTEEFKNAVMWAGDNDLRSNEERCFDALLASLFALAAKGKRDPEEFRREVARSIIASIDDEPQ